MFSYVREGREDTTHQHPEAALETRVLHVASLRGLATVHSRAILNYIFDSPQNESHRNIDFHLPDEGAVDNQLQGLANNVWKGYLKLCLWFISKCTLDKATAFSQPEGLTTVLGQVIFNWVFHSSQSVWHHNIDFHLPDKGTVYSQPEVLTIVLAQAIFNWFISKFAWWGHCV
jgi:hypothetical protein